MEIRFPDVDHLHRWTAAEKPRIVEKTSEDQASNSIVVWCNGVASISLCHRRRLILEGGSVEVNVKADVTSIKVVRQLDDRIRELERSLGHKAL